MTELRWIFFDCMETIIDVKKVPDQGMYASWAYCGSGLEKYWGDFTFFLEEYQEVSRILQDQFRPLEEFSLQERFKTMVARVFENAGRREIEKMVKILLGNYWKNYRENCFVEKELPELLAMLRKEFSLGVVSNFKKPGGIEELLSYFHIRSSFSFVVTSIGVGWQKPHPIIYLEALKRAGAEAEEVVFVGDNFSCDYCGPRRMGMKTVFLDRKNEYPGVSYRAQSLQELPRVIQNVSGVG